MDGTLKQLLAEVYACHREIEQLRKALAAAEAKLREKMEPPEKAEPEREAE